MSRLVDYFLVVGFESSSAPRPGQPTRTSSGSGKTLQRFPQKDWKDCPFIEGIELFCQPQGWSLSPEQQDPRFFVAVLTDIDANRHYCACLSFYEPVSITQNRSVDEEDDGFDGLIQAVVRGSGNAAHHHSIMYAPKCLVLVSRFEYFDIFKTCLGLMYTVFIEGIGVPFETLVGNLLGCVHVPPPGGPQFRFSLGASDKQAIQAPIHPGVPLSGSAVASLFQQLGIKNVLTIFCALLTDNKILFHSCSYWRLTEACQALCCLLFPFKYSYVYIPILPAPLLEVLSTPTPFLIGVHSAQKDEIMDTLDVVVADLDGGAVFVPDAVQVSPLPEPLLSNLHNVLSQILQPDLQCADFAFPPSSVRKSAAGVVDKEIRAAFLRMFAHLLQGYRMCLTIIRIHPKPVITFDKAAFLGQRGLIDCDFTNKLLECMFFSAFVTDRGTPWRICDLWDELYAALPDKLQLESHDPKLQTVHIQDLAHQLFLNENPSASNFSPKVPKPTEGAFTRIHQPTFPQLDPQKVQDLIDEGVSQWNVKCLQFTGKPQQPRIVPVGPEISDLLPSRHLFSNSARRLEVLRTCVTSIFENKIADARKVFPAVLRALKTKDARLALCSELAQHVFSSKATLETAQFDLIVRLMNRALMEDSPIDEHGVARAILPLATAFCRRLSPGVMQFAFTCIQDHEVWKNSAFWESSFYSDVQNDLRSFYLTKSRDGQPPPSPLKEAVVWRDRDKAKKMEPSALDIAAEQLRLFQGFPQGTQRELVQSEEATVYSQAIHYANRMVSLLVPLDSGGVTKKAASNDLHSVTDSVSNSNAESEHSGNESGFEEATQPDAGSLVVRTISRFIDKVCAQGEVSEPHLRALHQMITGVVAMHIESLEAVHREASKLPPIQKSKIVYPTLLNGEEIMFEPLRVYLLPDGRDEGAGRFGGPAFLPAEGAIFLTNYRLIFRGCPCDAYSSELTVVRAFPVSSLTKEKRITVQYVAHIDQWLQEGLQLRSNTLQLIRLAFDEEVTAEKVQIFCKNIHRVRSPPSVLYLFAFRSVRLQGLEPSSLNVPVSHDKNKAATLRGIAKKTFMKTARQVGLKPKKNKESPRRLQLSNSGVSISEARDEEDDESLDENELTRNSGSGISSFPVHTDPKTLERISERRYCKDYIRLGLGSLPITASTPSRQKDAFRISPVNSYYGLCRSYPALMVVPSVLSDDSVRRLARGHKGGRLPAAIWRHKKTGGIMLRSSSFHGKSVMGRIMVANAPAASNGVDMGAGSVEQERFVAAVVAATPKSAMRLGSSWGSDESMLSITSLVLTAGGGGLSVVSSQDSSATPDSGRKPVHVGQNFSKAMHTLKSSGRDVLTKSTATLGRWQGKKLGPAGGSPTLTQRNSSRRSVTSEVGMDCGSVFTTAALYIIGEKTHMKAMKSDLYQKTDFIGVEYPDVRQIRASFKKLMRACVPSNSTAESDQGLYKAIEVSKWLDCVHSIMRISGTVVDLLDIQGASVLVALEDGWDTTPQITSIAQLCLDPYYRTLDGFRDLVEKDWVAFGHRFSHRNGRDASSQTSVFTPVFLLFLDIVHQILKQFPMAFEFSEFYLKFLAYHSVSARFNTFLFDCERERAEFSDEINKAGQRTSSFYGDVSDDDGIFPGGRAAGRSANPSHGGSTSSIFDYISLQAAKSPVFHNFLYLPDPAFEVLRPCNNISDLRIWDYFFGEDLSHGPAYDLEIAAEDRRAAEEACADDFSANVSSRRIVAMGYDNSQFAQPDVFTFLHGEVSKLEQELGHLPMKWRHLWDKFECLPLDMTSHTSCVAAEAARMHVRGLHKRTTVEVLLRSKLGTAASSLGPSVGQGSIDAGVPIYSQPHRFEKYNYTTPTHCDLCSHILWGIVKTGLRCLDCGRNYHEKCADAAPRTCARYRTDGMQPSPVGQRALAVSDASGPGGVAGSGPSQEYPVFESGSAENRTHEGYLYKRGALLKAWKQRWFVLDSTMHQLRYYDTQSDVQYKGFIDMSEVVAVASSVPTQGAPKIADEKAFFDLKTTKRTYNFCAKDVASAQEWIEKIQGLLIQ